MLLNKMFGQLNDSKEKGEPEVTSEIVKIVKDSDSNAGKLERTKP
jgi:hypothetical protein